MEPNDPVGLTPEILKDKHMCSRCATIFEGGYGIRRGKVVCWECFTDRPAKTPEQQRIADLERVCLDLIRQAEYYRKLRASGGSREARAVGRMMDEAVDKAKDLVNDGQWRDAESG